MADFKIGTVHQAMQTAAQLSKSGHGEEAATAQRTTVADQIQLSSDARRRLEELTQGQTIAEAYLKAILEARLQEPSKAEFDGSAKDDEDAARQLSRAIDKVTLDLGWLVEALGIPPEESHKLRAVLAARATVDYMQARPPVPEILVRTQAEDGTAAVFVKELQFEVGSDGISNASVKQVAVTNSADGLVQQLNDPSAPRIVVMDDQRNAGSQGSQRAFADNLQARLLSAPHTELQGLLIVRENAATPDRIRLRIDALMPM